MSIHAYNKYDNARLGCVVDRVDQVDTCANLTSGAGLISAGAGLSYYAAVNTASTVGMIGIGSISGIALVAGSYFAMKAIVNSCARKPKEKLEPHLINFEQITQREEENRRSQAAARKAAITSRIDKDRAYAETLQAKKNELNKNLQNNNTTSAALAATSATSVVGAVAVGIFIPPVGIALAGVAAIAGLLNLFGFNQVDGSKTVRKAEQIQNELTATNRSINASENELKSES